MMAQPKKHNSTLDMCKRTIGLGDTISIRMLEYMSASKHPVHGFQTLAVDFLDLSRLIWTIDTGLQDAALKKTAIPAIITSELVERFYQVHHEFTVLNSMVTRLIEHENKKSGFGKVFRTMFSGTDLDKVRQTLRKSRDHLRMGSAMFQWTFGNTQLDASMGIGYAGLAAALQRMGLLPKEVEKPNVSSTITAAPARKTQALPSQMERTIKIQQSYEPSDNDNIPSSLVRSPSQKLKRADGDEKWQAPGEWGGRPQRGPTAKKSIRGDPVDDSGNSSDESLNSRTYANSDETLSSSNLQRFSQNETARSIRRHAPSITTLGGQTAIVDRGHKLEPFPPGSGMEAGAGSNSLRSAIQNRDMGSIELLLSSGGNVNGADKHGYTPLYTAAETGDIEIAKLLLELNADTNLSASPLKISPLCLAACQGRTDFVDLFLQHGGDVNKTMGNGSTALIYMMDHDTTPEVVKMITKNNDIDVNFKNQDGATPLFQCILGNRVDLLEVLLDAGANPNLPAPKHPLWPSTYKPKVLQLMLARGGDVGKTPGIMELASSLKNLESIKILINAGVSPNIRKDGIYTPLCSAIRDNSKDIVAYLLANGADPNLNAAEYPAFKSITHNRPHFLPQLVAAGVDLRSPKGIIECAVAKDNKEALMYLLKQGVPINDKNAEGNTALTTAIREGNKETVQLLLDHGADPAVRGADWPICMAVKRPDLLKLLLDKIPNPRSFRGVVEMAVVADQLQSIKLLLGAGVCVEDKNCGVFSPLTTAIRERNKQIVRYLLDEAKADPNAPGEHLPIVKALRRLLPGDTEILQMLLAHGVDINKMHRGWNAVLQAIENGDAEILRLLMQHGGPVDLTLTDEVGKTVLEVCQERGWEEGMAMLCPGYPKPE